jgi:hypothetical protein
LILAGETPPRRGAGRVQLAGSAEPVDVDANDAADSASGSHSQQVTIISARVDAVVTQGLYTPGQKAPVPAAATLDPGPLGKLVGTWVASASGTQPPSIPTSSLPAAPAELVQAHVVSNRTASSYALYAYARTRDLADRTSLIDTYA